jgi:hypothetical protein
MGIKTRSQWIPGLRNFILEYFIVRLNTLYVSSLPGGRQETIDFIDSTDSLLWRVQNKRHQ